MSDVKAEPVSFCLNGLSRYAFGDRWRFGVECEVQDSSISCVRTVLAEDQHVAVSNRVICAELLWSPA
jgi:hypothetical protein